MQINHFVSIQGQLLLYCPRKTHIDNLNKTGLSLFLVLLGQLFPIFETTLFGLGSLMRVQYPKFVYGQYC